MFEIDHSAARGKMCMHKLIVFRHESPLGNAPSHILFDHIRVQLKDDQRPPRHFTDYAVSIDRQMPEKVALLEKL
jgi:CRISPR-associated protein Csd2